MILVICFTHFNGIGGLIRYRESQFVLGMVQLEQFALRIDQCRRLF